MNADHSSDDRPILVFATHNPNKVREHKKCSAINTRFRA